MIVMFNKAFDQSLRTERGDHGKAASASQSRSVRGRWSNSRIGSLDRLRLRREVLRLLMPRPGPISGRGL